MSQHKYHILLSQVYDNLCLFNSSDHEFTKIAYESKHMGVDNEDNERDVQIDLDTHLEDLGLEDQPGPQSTSAPGQSRVTISTEGDDSQSLIDILDDIIDNGGSETHIKQAINTWLTSKYGNGLISDPVIAVSMANFENMQAGVDTPVAQMSIQINPSALGFGQILVPDIPIWKISAGLVSQSFVLNQPENIQRQMAMFYDIVPDEIFARYSKYAKYPFSSINNPGDYGIYDTSFPIAQKGVGHVLNKWRTHPVTQTATEHGVIQYGAYQELPPGLSNHQVDFISLAPISISDMLCEAELLANGNFKLNYLSNQGSENNNGGQIVDMWNNAMQNAEPPEAKQLIVVGDKITPEYLDQQNISSNGNRIWIMTQFMANIINILSSQVLDDMSQAISPAISPKPDIAEMIQTYLNLYSKVLEDKYSPAQLQTVDEAYVLAIGQEIMGISGRAMRRNQHMIAKQEIPKQVSYNTYNTDGIPKGNLFHMLSNTEPMWLEKSQQGLSPNISNQNQYVIESIARARQAEKERS